MEDLSLAFLSWPVIKVNSAGTAYQVSVRNPNRGGAYSWANVSIDRKTLGLLKVDAYERDDSTTVAKEIKIWGYKKYGEQWLPKKIAVTTRENGKKQSSTSIQITRQKG